MNRKLLTIALTLAFLAPVAAPVAANAASWPDFQAGLKPAATKSSVKAALPADVAVKAPAGGAPAELAKLSGVWSGWMCQDRACDVKIAVEQVDAKGGVFVYAFASAEQGRFASRIKAKASGGELSGKAGDATVTIRLRKDGHMDIMWQRGKRWATGILKKG